MGMCAMHVCVCVCLGKEQTFVRDERARYSGAVELSAAMMTAALAAVVVDTVLSLILHQ